MQQLEESINAELASLQESKQRIEGDLFLVDQKISLLRKFVDPPSDNGKPTKNPVLLNRADFRTKAKLIEHIALHSFVGPFNSQELLNMANAVDPGVFKSDVYNAIASMRKGRKLVLVSEYRKGGPTGSTPAKYQAK